MRAVIVEKDTAVVTVDPPQITNRVHHPGMDPGCLGTDKPVHILGACIVFGVKEADDLENRFFDERSVERFLHGILKQQTLSHRGISDRVVIEVLQGAQHHIAALGLHQLNLQAELVRLPEIVRIEKPENSYAALDEMIAHVEGLVNALGLKYRILRLCGGDMSFTSAITYDFELWSAAQGRWLEISSVSNFETFQANRLKCRYKDADGKTQLVHTLNGSSLALPRVVAALLEDNQKEGYIEIPEVLRPYTGFDRID